MTQTRLGSLIEAVMNTAIGFGINFCANLIILPLFGFNVSLAQNFFIGVLYTAISVARSYAVRRWFNARLHATSANLARRISS